MMDFLEELTIQIFFGPLKLLRGAENIFRARLSFWQSLPLLTRVGSMLTALMRAWLTYFVCGCRRLMLTPKFGSVFWIDSEKQRPMLVGNCCSIYCLGA